MKYLSVCSGIEAATVAWHPLGFQPTAFAELDKFPSRLLAHHYPSVPNLGDMTKFKDWPRENIDILVGGTPCQSFSIAGLRKGLADPRGNLALTYCAILDRYRPRWCVWENVPGVLSSDGGRAFGSILGAMAELGYGFAYRVLDAQYVRVDGFGRAVPQRRRRVFVVGYLGNWRRAAEVLFEPESLSWHSAPRRQAGQGVAADVAPSIVSSGRGTERIGETRGQDPVIAVPSISHCLNADGMGRNDYETETMIAHALRAEGFDASEDGTGRGTPLVPIAIQAGALRENPTSGPDGIGVKSGVSYTLEARSEVQAVAYDLRGRDQGSQFEGPHDTANIRAASGGSSRSYVAQTWAVRRLTPIECERLQGFPDGYTAIPDAADGPRYKSLGNSMAVNVMRWIGKRIAMVNARPVVVDFSDFRAALLGEVAARDAAKRFMLRH